MAIWLPTLDQYEGPLYLRIVEAMAADIASGKLAAGTQLLPHRELAYQLGISPNTVSRAYALAVKRALLQGEVGRGTFVREPAARKDGAASYSLLRSDEGPIDLSRNLPIPGFSEPYIARMMEEISGRAGFGALLDYQTKNDLGRHTSAGAQWLAHWELPTNPEHVLVTIGVQQGIHAALSALLAPGDLLLTEALTYTPVLSIADRLGLQTAPVPMDAGGILPNALEHICKTAKPRMLYVTPTLQAPTTVTLSEERRRALADIASRYDLILLEDDVFAPLKEGRPDVIARHAPDHTVYLNGLSKGVAPGLRVGFLHAASRYIPAIRRAINETVWMTPPMMAEIAAGLIANGSAAALSKQQRDAAAQRREIAMGLLGDLVPGVAADGLHLWLPLPAGWRADVFRAQCARKGVLVTEARSFAVDPQTAPEAIRICLSHEVHSARVEAGLQIVADTLRYERGVANVEI